MGSLLAAWSSGVLKKTKLLGRESRKKSCRDAVKPQCASLSSTPQAALIPRETKAQHEGAQQREGLGASGSYVSRAPAAGLPEAATELQPTSDVLRKAGKRR